MGFARGWEWIIILAVVLLLFGFGTTKLPKIGTSLGQGLRNFKQALTGKDEAPTSKGRRSKAKTQEKEEEDQKTVTS